LGADPAADLAFAIAHGETFRDGDELCGYAAGNLRQLKGIELSHGISR
jgi:hypothetical protein